jgi:hypothetical protein
MNAGGEAFSWRNLALRKSSTTPLPGTQPFPMGGTRSTQLPRGPVSEAQLLSGTKYSLLVFSLAVADARWRSTTYVLPRYAFHQAHANGRKSHTRFTPEAESL